MPSRGKKPQPGQKSAVKRGMTPALHRQIRLQHVFVALGSATVAANALETAVGFINEVKPSDVLLLPEKNRREMETLLRSVRDAYTVMLSVVRKVV